jgi:hypothetical protein
MNNDAACIIHEILGALRVAEARTEIQIENASLAKLLHKLGAPASLIFR